MGSTFSPDEVPRLIALEQIAPKGYLRYIFLFPLPDQYDLNEVADVVKAGYSSLKQRIPFVGCEAIPDADSKQPGFIKLQRTPEGSVKDIVVRDLRSSPESFQPTYSELKSSGFPVAAFDSETLCRRSSPWPSPGEQLPISLVQANFIHGGLILTWCVLHIAGDGTSFHTWMKVWAEGCRLAQGLESSSSPVDLAPELWLHRQSATKSSGRSTGLLAHHPEYTLLPFTPTGAPPKMTSPHHRSQVFYFSPAALAALKADASPVHATEPTDQSWISTNDALSALLWRTVMAVQSPLHMLDDGSDPVSVFNIAIDGRLRTDPPVHPETLGCFLESVAVEASIRDMLGTLTVADLAVRIRKALLRADSHFTDDVVALVEKLEVDVNRLILTAFLDVPGFNCAQTSWANFDMYGLDWGPMLGGRVESVRTPSEGVINGLQVVLPVLPDGGMEVLVGVEEGCLDRLLHDPLWLKYAVPR
ncbi:hypothetical protein FE257_005351 [Aspergillus nanangensis]|uniref:Trichothecene 3-O-acetyltransferase-like N-terminal domain-containing protein n=1 Tax=Aspergillus nanangensis TaxID=2582783 RepID=A0AAD4CQK7_ASPNN|nr:hypothetical protein FE257_005351 [Aspergillus nanangensis]